MNEMERINAEIEKLNSLGGPYHFKYAGTGDYVTVTRNNVGVATIRVQPQGISGFLGIQVAEVMAFLKEKLTKEPGE